jgi:multiple sugar transport system permease protein
MTLIMYLNKHLYSKNYGLAGALSVVLFVITGALSLLVYRISNGKESRG